MQTDFTQLADTKYMLLWFSDNPFEDITTMVEDMFRQQVADTKLLSFEVVSAPEWITGGKRKGDDTVIVVRSGMAVPCRFTLQSQQTTHQLEGIFTWVGVNLDTHPVTNMWIDLDGSLEEFGQEGKLQSRIYELEQSP